MTDDGFPADDDLPEEVKTSDPDGDTVDDPDPDEDDAAEDHSEPTED